jgi:hypothetical protein
VNRVPLARTAVGVNVAVVPAKVIVPATGAAPGPIKVNVAALMVAGFMSSLNVAETRVLTGTATAPLAGTVEITMAAGAVVKLHTKLAASGTPVRFFAPVVIVAVNKVLVARTAVGVKVAVVPAKVTVPATGVAPGPVTVNVAPLIVAGFIASLNVAEIGVLTATDVAPLAGTVETTVAGGAVVKVHTKLAASPAPVGSFAPVVIVAVNKVLVARTAVGVKVAVVPAKVTVPATGVAPGPVTVNVAPLIVAGFIASLNVAEIGVLPATSAAPLAGTVETTVGAGAVVKFHTKLAASGMPVGSFAPVVTVAVNKVLVARTVVGANVAVEPAKVTVPPMGVAPGPVNVKVAALIVAGFIASLKVAEIVVLTATAVAPVTGMVETTDGAGAVVKVHTKLAARGTPVGSFAPVVIVAIYKVPVVRADEGVNVAVVPAKVTPPFTGVAPGPANVNVAALMVAGFMGSLKVAEIVVLRATPVAPFAGTVEMTVGGGAVVKDHTKLAASGTPVGSFAPVVIVAVNEVLVARMVVGVNVAVVPAKVTVPFTGVAPGPVKVNVAALIVAGFIASLNVAEIVVLTATPVVPLAGTVEITVGAGAVAKVHTKLAASPAPVGFFAPVVIVAVNRVPLARTVVGVNVAVAPAKVTVPFTGVAPGPVKVNVDALIVAGFMASLNVAETVVLTATPVAPLTGTVEITVGAAAVVKAQTKLAASPAPAGFFAPVVIVAVNKVLVARTVVGVNVAVVPAKMIVPGTGVVPGPVKVNVAELIVAGFMA